MKFDEPVCQPFAVVETRVCLPGERSWAVSYDTDLHQPPTVYQYLSKTLQMEIVISNQSNGKTIYRGTVLQLALMITRESLGIKGADDGTK